jgi:hypothetical protein
MELRHPIGRHIIGQFRWCSIVGHGYCGTWVHMKGYKCEILSTNQNCFNLSTMKQIVEDEAYDHMNDRWNNEERYHLSANGLSHNQECNLKDRPRGALL